MPFMSPGNGFAFLFGAFGVGRRGSPLSGHGRSAT
jgi:hypothetical protein